MYWYWYNCKPAMIYGRQLYLPQNTRARAHTHARTHARAHTHFFSLIRIIRNNRPLNKKRATKLTSSTARSPKYLYRERGLEMEETIDRHLQRLPH